MENHTQVSPTVVASGHDYAPPRHNVLLLSCMDPRLLDELVRFMNRDNLTNRYDHVVLAGASLGVLQQTLPTWRTTFFDHLRLALDLHQVQDIYIVEHRCCGAYRLFQKKEYGEAPEEQKQEEHDHAVNAFRLADEIHAWCDTQTTDSGGSLKLGIHCFLMDLRGHVGRLADPRVSLASGPKKGTRTATAASRAAKKHA